MAASQILLGLLVSAFVMVGAALIVGTDETLERRISGCGSFKQEVQGFLVWFALGKHDVDCLVAMEYKMLGITISDS